jgi:hypothetical protein
MKTTILSLLFGTFVLGSSFAQHKLPLTGGVSLTQPSCNGSSDGNIELLISGGQYPYRYQWSTGDTLSSLSNVPAGNYSVIVSDVTLSMLTIDVVVTNPAPITLNASIQHVSSMGGSDGSIDVNVQGNNGDFTYFWLAQVGSNIDLSSLDQSNLSSGSYTLSVTDEKGCSATRTFSVHQKKPVLSGVVNPETTPFTSAAEGTNIQLAYPNPSSGMVYFKNNEGIQSITISNMTGIRIAKIDTEQVVQGIQLNKGTYTAHILFQNGKTAQQRIFVE